MTTILGLDPAAKTGFALSTGAHGVWEITSKSDKHCGRRLERLRKFIYRAHREHRLTVIATEDAAFGSNNLNTAAMHNELRGVIKLAAAELDIPVVMVKPSQLKKWLTGHGRAQKQDMIDSIRTRFGIYVCSDDVADAIAVMEFARETILAKEKKNGESKVSCP